MKVTQVRPQKATETPPKRYVSASQPQKVGQ